MTSIIGIAIILGLLIKLAPLTVTHALYYCQKIITQSNFSLPHSAPVLLVIGFVLILVSGTALFVIKAYSTHIYMRRLLRNKIQSPKRVIDVGYLLNLNQNIDIIYSKELLSFSYGLVNPRICLSTATINVLDQEELHAVLLHESSHLRNHDPIKIILTQVISSMFFFLPILKDFQQLFTLAKEVDADNLVIVNKGTSRDLRSALKKLLSHATPTTISVAPFMQSTMLEERVLILTGITKKIPLNLSITRLSISLGVVIIALLFLTVPLYAMETNPNEHAYLVCPGDKCATYCVEKAETTNDLFPEPHNISSVNYPTNL